MGPLWTWKKLPAIWHSSWIPCASQAGAWKAPEPDAIGCRPLDVNHFPGSKTKPLAETVVPTSRAIGEELANFPYLSLEQSEQKVGWWAGSTSEIASFSQYFLPLHSASLSQTVCEKSAINAKFAKYWRSCYVSKVQDGAGIATSSN